MEEARQMCQSSLSRVIDIRTYGIHFFIASLSIGPTVRTKSIWDPISHAILILESSLF